MPPRDAASLDQRPASDWLPALTGIRGISILLVLAFHLGLPVANGGPVGVTVFFVLSGYLITMLLVREVARTGVIDLRAFYLRRARRLLPALVFAIAVVLVIAAATGQASSVATDSLLALTYVANWARAEGDLMGMWNHAWSLAIEEQFYLLWPIGVIALCRLGSLPSTRVIAVVIGLAAASAVLRAALIDGGATGDRIYFGSDTRSEALLAGCALALIVARRPRWQVPRRTGPIALVSLVALASLPTAPSPWPGAPYTIVTAVSCGLVLAALRPDGGRAGLSWRPLMWLGERSYSLYLWHVPVTLAMAPGLGGVHPLARVGVLAAVSLLLASVSYEFIERPFRSAGHHRILQRQSGRRAAEPA